MGGGKAAVLIKILNKNPFVRAARGQVAERPLIYCYIDVVARKSGNCGQVGQNLWQKENKYTLCACGVGGGREWCNEAN